MWRGDKERREFVSCLYGESPEARRRDAKRSSQGEQEVSQVIKLRNLDPVWAIAAAVSLIIGIIIPSGVLGMVLYIVAKEYWKMAKEW